MIEVMELVDAGTCRNCGAPIVLFAGDVEWHHKPDATREGVFVKHCANSPVAEPLNWGPRREPFIPNPEDDA